MEFVIARNPDPDSSLPYLVRLPLGPSGIALKVRDTWPRTAKVYCHRADEWPAELDIIERVPVRSCVRRGAAIDLVLDRGRENRSQFVFANARGREVIFWQSARTSKQARPAVALPTARAAGLTLEVLVDTHEQYPWRFSQQQAVTRRRALTTGDYAVAVEERVLAVVERKSLADLVGTLISGKLRYLLADLATVPRAALVVEDRWSSVFKLDRVRPSVVADGLAEAQVRFPTIPIVFCETRPLAQEWAYRFLGAALAHAGEHEHAAELERRLPAAGPVGRAEPTVAEIRAWAIAAGLPVADKGRLRPEVRAAYEAAGSTRGE
ncbi:MAG: ERCC4 domain-containing protein [Ilumatobacteraceae bacterium]